DRAGNFGYYLNSGMVETEALTDAGETAFVRGMIERHVQWTGSEYAAAILARWNEEQARFVKVIPTEYKKVLAGR
ncbi:MAG: hypothetical protein LBG74_03115, partial [Spirochaetaceae bacterium]|nr:hypothetical protein [Spirochaetaceae bacterium]